MRLLRPSPDGTRLVTISIRSEQAPPLLWDLDQHRLISRLDGHVGRVFTARFVAEGGREILTAASDGTVRLWDAATGSPRQIFRGDSHSLADAALAPDGSVIVAGGSDGFLRFWDTSNGHLLWMLQAHSSFVIGVHWEGGELVTRSHAGDVARWALPSPDKVIEACHARTCASPTMEEKIAL
jgi:WD40 repeat protein